MPSVYLETTIFGYLASRPTRNLIVAGHQRLTRAWWTTRAKQFDLRVSTLVIEEIAAGDPRSARARLKFTAGIPVVEMTASAIDLADTYRTRLPLPPRAARDALHIALAVVHELDYLLTWNCAHIANGHVILRLQLLNRKRKRTTPVILTPEELMEPMEPYTP